MNIGFIGLGNVGGKLAGNLINNDFQIVVRDLDQKLVDGFVARGAQSANSPKEMMEMVDIVITCLPSPAACSQVMEADDGVIAGIKPDQLWMEMSTTDESEVRRIAELVQAKGAMALESPVSGGCHRAATGNIAILAGGERAAFEKALPVLTTLGRKVLHSGEIGSASKLKVMTNYLATTNLISLAEALTVAAKAGLDLNTTFEAIRISSGNSFVHETESQVILNGSRDINFTMDLVCKDVGLFDSWAQEVGVPLELSPLVLKIFEEAQAEYGPRELSPNIIRRYEEAVGVKVSAPGFPPEMVDDEPPAKGAEVIPKGKQA